MSTTGNSLHWSAAPVKEPLTVPTEPVVAVNSQHGIIMVKGLASKEPSGEGPMADSDDENKSDDEERQKKTGEKERQRDKYCSKCGGRLGADFVCHNGC